MKILIVGSGGREHAIGWTLAQSPQNPTLFFAPGNPGVEALGQRLEIEVEDIQGLLLFAQREQIDLTVVGPEVPLSMGIVDRFQEAGLLIFGPTQAGAHLEASKAFAKKLMQQAGVPTAGYRFCQTEPEALAALSDFVAPYVIKEDGLAAGKGVTIAATQPEAETAIKQAFAKNMPVVIEEFMTGEELSLLALCDGTRALPLVSAQDFKKVGEGNTGPNTGGMGAYAPVPFVTPALLQTIQQTVLNPMLEAFKAQGIVYKGILYAGLMITPEKQVKVVEFNVRFGDPETQVVLPLLQDDLVDLLLASAKGDLSAYEASGIRFKPGMSAVTVVLASQGYPGSFEKGLPITFPENPQVVTGMLFHAGTKKLPGGQIVTHGGRVLNATGVGASIAQAREQAYALAQQVTFANKYCRPDIAAAVTPAPVLL